MGEGKESERQTDVQTNKRQNDPRKTDEIATNSRGGKIDGEKWTVEKKPRDKRTLWAFT